MGHTEVDAVAFVTHRTTRETVIEFAICGRICIEHESGALERPALLPPPRASVPPLPALSAPLAPDAEALTRAAVEAVARAERSVLPTVRPGRHVVEVVGATEAA